MITGVVNDDHEAIIRLLVQGPVGQEREIEAVIDTGFDGWLSLPSWLISALGLTWRRRGRALLADGSESSREVAVKLLERIDDEEMRRRFAREARAVGRLKHQNIVTIHDMGEHGNQPFIVMEYIQGETFQHLIRRKAPLPITRKLQLIEDLCAGLAHAHAAGIITSSRRMSSSMLQAW